MLINFKLNIFVDHFNLSTSILWIHSMHLLCSSHTQDCDFFVARTFTNLKSLCRVAHANKFGQYLWKNTRTWVRRALRFPAAPCQSGENLICNSHLECALILSALTVCTHAHYNFAHNSIFYFQFWANTLIPVASKLLSDTLPGQPGAMCASVCAWVRVCVCVCELTSAMRSHFYPDFSFVQ